MKELLSELSKPLSKEDVELRIGQVNQKGFSLLLYKTARTDIKRLNDSGAIWKNEHNYDHMGLLTCKISVYDKEHGIWIDRVDVGTESQTEKVKGLYSDSFKRCGFRWGIGLELYNAPFIWINWEMQEYKGKWQPKNFYASNLSIEDYETKDGHFTKLTIKYNNDVKFSMNKEIKPKNDTPVVKQYKTASSANEADRKNYREEFYQRAGAYGFEQNMFKEFLHFLGIDVTDGNAIHNATAKFLKSENLLCEQVTMFIEYRRKQRAS